MPYTHPLTNAEKSELLRIARATLREFLNSGRIPPGKPHRQSLLEDAEVFVTLMRQRALRGCIGTQTPRPIYRVIQETVIAAASRDPRFDPVTKDELDDITIEISVLGDYTTIQTPDQIQLGQHGLIIQQGNQSGLLLPQIPNQHNWDAKTFLEQVAIKAGLAADAWKASDTTTQAFTAQIFEETVKT